MIIGIDPDTEKSGYASFWHSLTLNNLSLPELAYLLMHNKHIITNAYISAGWLNRSNFHHRKGMNSAIVAQIGERTGANHEIGKQIAKFCEFYGIAYTLVKPTTSKPTHEYLCRISKDFAQFKRSNQEQRDAFMCILGRY